MGTSPARTAAFAAAVELAAGDLGRAEELIHETKRTYRYFPLEALYEFRALGDVDKLATNYQRNAACPPPAPGEEPPSSEILLSGRACTCSAPGGGDACWGGPLWLLAAAVWERRRRRRSVRELGRCVSPHSMHAPARGRRIRPE